MLLFIDGFSHYATAALSKKWTTVNSAFCTFAVVAEGRVDGCVRRTSTSNQALAGYLALAPFMTQNGAWTPTLEGRFGCALKVTDVSANANHISGGLDHAIFSVYSGNTGMFGILLNQDGTFSAKNDGTFGATLVADSIEGITDNVWSYIEFGWKLAKSPAVGYIKIRRNGTLIMDYAGEVWPSMYPFAEPLPHWTSIRVMGANSIPTPLLEMRMCDVYLTDTVGAIHNDFLGDVVAAYILPDGVGSYAQWTPVGAANNWQCQDEVPPNDETDYVSVTTVNQRDSYNFQNLLGEPIGMQISADMRTEVAGGAAFKPTARIGGADYEFQQFGIGDTAYALYLQPLDTDPNTGLEWTKAVVDASEFGIIKKG
jgi:hypothetical protein